MAKTGLAASLSKKKEIDIEKVQKGVSQLHPSLEKKETSKKSSQESQVREYLSEEFQKFNVFVTKEQHKKIKLYCTDKNIKIKDFASRALLEKAKKMGIIE